MKPKTKAVDRMAANKADNGFYGQDILSVSQFDRTKLDFIFGVADEMRVLVERFGSADLLHGKILANLFYEPSTRTSSSFMASMLRLGGQVIPINNVQYSSVTKGESLPDTIRTLESYSDIIVHSPSRSRLSGYRRALCQQAHHQRRRRRRRASYPGAAGSLHHYRGVGRRERTQDRAWWVT